MSWPIMRDMLDMRLPKLTASEKLVLIALGRYADEEGKSIYPSVATVAVNANLSESQVHKILRKLQSIRYVRVLHSNPGGNFYATTQRALNLSVIKADGDQARVVKRHKKESKEGFASGVEHPDEVVKMLSDLGLEGMLRRD